MWVPGASAKVHTSTPTDRPTRDTIRRRSAPRIGAGSRSTASRQHHRQESMLESFREAPRNICAESRCCYHARAGHHFSSAPVRAHAQSRSECSRCSMRSSVSLSHVRGAVSVAAFGPVPRRRLELAELMHADFAAARCDLWTAESISGVGPGLGALAAPSGPGSARRSCSPARPSRCRRPRAMGLVDEIAEDPATAALAYIEEHLASARKRFLGPRSPTAARPRPHGEATRRLASAPLPRRADGAGCELEGLQAFRGDGGTGLEWSR